MTTIQTQKNSINQPYCTYYSLFSKKELELVGNSQVVPRLCLLLYAIVRLFIAITSTKFQLSMYTQLLALFPGPAQLSVVRACRESLGTRLCSCSLFYFCREVDSTPPARSSTEHVFSYGDKMKTGPAKVSSIRQNIERKRTRFQEKYSKGGITRAAVNENVCEDSHTEHV